MRSIPGGAVVENPPTSAGDARDEGSLRGSGGSPGVGNGNLLQYSCLGSSHGQRSLMGCTPWGHKELDTAERTRVWEACS